MDGIVFTSSAAQIPAQSLKINLGVTVHIPASVFPNEKCPPCGYWSGSTVKTSKGGASDVGILVQGDEVFTRPIAEAAMWVVAQAAVWPATRRPTSLVVATSFATSPVTV